MFFFLGIIAGTITGIVPGVHVNTITFLILSISPFLLSHFSPLTITIFIVSLAITHTFLNFIPSVFLGAPDTDTALSVLPGHKLLDEGKGYEAIIHSLHGSLIGLVIIIILTPLFIFTLPLIYNYVESSMFYILITASIFLIWKEEKSRGLAIIVFFLSGFLGIASGGLDIRNSLMPLLAGLFGASSLITGILKKEDIPKQKTGGMIEVLKGSINEFRFNKNMKNIAIVSSLSAPLCCFLPSLGSSQAGVIGSNFIDEVKAKDFLVLLGAINTIVAGLAFITLYSISRSRTGAAVAIEEIIPLLNLSHLIVIVTVIIASGIFSIFLTIYIGKKASDNINRIGYKKLSKIVLTFLAIISLLFSGPAGLLIFIVATATGLTGILLGIKRTHLMGSLMIPTILFYFPL